MNELENKVAIVTGGAGGIGRATAARFLAAGARVVLVDRDEAALAQAAETLGARVVTVRADVASEADVERYVARAVEVFGGVDIVIANAGTEGRVAPLTMQTEADFDRVLAVNVRGPFLAIKHGAPRIAERGGGAIVVTSSVAGLIGAAGLAPYVASKHAVIGLVKSAAIELAATNIRVNAVNPGPVENRMMRSIEEQASPGHADEVKRGFAAKAPMQRYATNEEIADAMLFLASPASRFVTGTTLVVDGGFCAG